MAKSKVDFIVDLLENEKISSSQKEKLFALTANEIKNFGETELEILKEIEIIKEKIGLSEEKKKEPDITSVPSSLPNYINPSNTSYFLMEFNQNIFLKSTTHIIDTNMMQSIIEHLGIPEYDFDKHLTAIKKEFAKLSNKYYGKIPLGLSSKIYRYLNGNKTWSENEIKLSWASNELKEWADRHPGKCPNPGTDLGTEAFLFDRIKLNNGAYLKDFNDLVLFFKKQVTIRNDNSLKDLCNTWSFEFREKANIDWGVMPANIEFFTDVEKLHQAFRTLINMCLEANPNEKIQIELGLLQTFDKDQGSKIIFTVKHKNSTFTKNIYATLNRYGSSFTGLIKNQINGMCDFRLRADFGDGEYGLLSLWPKVQEPEMIEKFEGVQYELIFNY